EVWVLPVVPVVVVHGGPFCVPFCGVWLAGEVGWGLGGEAERDRGADQLVGGRLVGGLDDLDGDAVVAGVAAVDAGLAGAAGAGGLVDLALGADGVVDAGAGGGDDAAVLQQLRRLGDLALGADAVVGAGAGGADDAAVCEQLRRLGGLLRRVLGGGLAVVGAGRRVSAGAVAGARCAGAVDRAAAPCAAGGRLGVLG